MYTHPHTEEYYSAVKKKEIGPFITTQMDLQGIILSEIREMQIPYDLIYMLKLKNKNKNPSSQTWTTVWQMPGAEVGKLSEGGQKAQTLVIN